MKEVKAMKRIISLTAGLLLLAGAGLAQSQETYEVWAVDQSDSLDGTATGGVLYVFSGTDEDYLQGKASRTHQVNLKPAAEAAGFEGGLKPHMTLFNSGATHMLIGHASSGHVYAVDADSKEIVDVAAPGGNSHAAIPAPNNQFVLVADIPGKTIYKVATDYAAGKGNIFGATQSLEVNGKPICPIITADSSYGYITLSEGGLDIVDLGSMTIAHSYSQNEIGPNGCGGIQKDDIMFVNSGNPDPATVDYIYAFDNAKLPGKPQLYTVPQAGNDSHALVLVGNYLWGFNRASNTVNVHDVSRSPFAGNADPADRLRMVHAIDLQGRILKDAAPDLADISPSGKVVFIAQRGPKPISANNKDFDNAKGNAPGVGVIEVTSGGRGGRARAHYSLSHIVGGTDVADIHALRVRK